MLLDASAQHAGRTGREVLTLAALTMWRRPPARVDEMLDLVGLTARRRAQARRATTRWACGSGSASRTRCSATRSVLILDEPANGLDPEGIFWMRGLLRDFADRGGTVLLSSHLLREVEAVADQLVVIGDGRIVAEGDKAELLAGDRARSSGRWTGPPCRRAARRAGLAGTPRPDGAAWSRPTPRPSAGPRPTPASCCSSCARPAAAGSSRCS